MYSVKPRPIESRSTPSVVPHSEEAKLVRDSDVDFATAAKMIASPKRAISVGRLMTDAMAQQFYLLIYSTMLIVEKMGIPP